MSFGSEELLEKKDVETILAQFTEEDWTLVSVQFARINTKKISDSAIKFLARKISTDISNGQYTQAYNHIVFILAIFPNIVEEDYKFLESFCILGHNVHSTKQISYLIDRIFLFSTNYITYKPTINSINSISNFMEVAESYAQAVSELRTYIEDCKDWLFVTALSYVEECFLGIQPNSESKLSSKGNKYKTDFTQEAIASGVSYLLNISESEINLKGVTVRFDKVDKLEEIILVCIQLNSFREILPKITRMGFEFQKINEKQFRLYHSEPNIEKSIDLGFTKNKIQGILTVGNVKSQKGTSFVKICQEFAEQLDEKFFYILGDPGKERLVVGIPEPIVPLILEDFQFHSDDLFLEEFAELSFLKDEFQIEIDEFLDVELAPNFTFMKFLKIHRLNMFFAITRIYKMKKLNSTNHQVYKNSVLGIADFKDFLDHHILFKFTAEDVNQYLELFSWGKHKEDVPRDLQYHPIINWRNESIIFPFALIANTNIFRNILITTKVRPNGDGARDPMSSILKATLNKTWSSCMDGVELNFKGKDAQIDVLMFEHDTLYFFECKSSLFPTNSFELRTTYDQLDKANYQLDIFQQFCQDPEFIKLLNEKTGWQIPQQVKFVSCIVLGNRLLSGVKYNGHPIRHFGELRNYLLTGESRFTTADGNLLHAEKYWNGESCSIGDLNSFLSDDCRLYKDLFFACTQMNLLTVVGDYEVISHRFPVDNNKFVELFKIDLGKLSQ